MKSTYKYNLLDRDYRNIQISLQVFIMGICSTVIASITILYVIQGFHYKHVLLQYSKYCDEECQHLVTKQYFPAQSHLQIDKLYDKAEGIMLFKFQRNDNFNYYLCNEIEYTNAQTTQFSPLQVDEKDVSLYQYTFSKNNVTVEIYQNGVVMNKDFQILPIDNETISITVQQSIETFYFANLQLVNAIYVLKYNLQNCVKYSDEQPFWSFQYLITELKPGKFQQFHQYNFEVSKKVLQDYDYFYFTLIGLSGVGLIETFSFFIFLCCERKRINQRKNDWQQYICQKIEEQE